MLSTKDRVLSALQNADGVVSGERLAELCGVSRTAVWKAVSALKERGYPINAESSKGYKIAPSADLLSAEQIKQMLKSRAAGTTFDSIDVFVFNEIDSTNSHARRLIADSGSLFDAAGNLSPNGKKLHRSVFIADRQSAGRGRMGRPFDSPAGCGLYLSLIYCPQKGGTDTSRWTTGAAVAVCRTIAALFGIECGIKWVNDVFIGKKKVCGILSEGVSSFESGLIEAIVVGIGINVRSPPDGFAPEIKNIAGAITQDAPPDCPPRNRIASELIFHLLDIYQNENPDGTLAEYKRRSIILGKRITVFPLAGDETPYAATALDIDEKANLIVQTKNGHIKSLSSGEVKITK